MRMLAVLLLAAVPLGAARADLAANSQVFIGNSLTWDTVINRFDGEQTWHIECGQSLDYIYQHPDAPCETSSTPWPTALASQQFDYLVVQPYRATSLAADAAAISAWWQLQPTATLVIHDAWGGHATAHDEFHDADLFNDDGLAVHSVDYARALIAELRANAANPAGDIRLTQTSAMIDAIYHDIEAGVGPYDDLADIYRDDLHMAAGPPLADNKEGRYLVHNAMRQALGQPLSVAGFEGIDPAKQAYLDGVIARVGTSVSAVPESAAAIGLAGGAGGLVLLLAQRRRPPRGRPAST